jgi:deazaflavin-dependent oxidoreductase (nitroreductase family)
VDKRRASTFASHRLLNPFVKAAARAGLPLPGLVILETTGRKTGQPRRTPVGKALEGDTLWVLAEHRRGGYVRNIEANPRPDREDLARRHRPGAHGRRRARARPPVAEPHQHAGGAPDGERARYGPGRSRSGGGGGGSGRSGVAFGMTAPMFDRACVISLGMIQTLLASPSAI